MNGFQQVQVRVEIQKESAHRDVVIQSEKDRERKERNEISHHRRSENIESNFNNLKMCPRPNKLKSKIAISIASIYSCNVRRKAYPGSISDSDLFDLGI